MANGLRHFFALPQYENPDRKISARLIFLVSLGMIVTTLIFVFAVPFAAPALSGRATILAFTTIPAWIGIMMLVRFSRLWMAGNLFLIMIWLVITLGSITAGGVSAPIFVGYFLLLVVSGLISGTRIHVRTMLICAASGIVIAYAETNGLLPKPREYSPFARVSIYIFFFVLALLVQNITTGNIRQLLKDTSESEFRYRSFLENIPSITYINGLGAESPTTYVSPQVKEFLGYTREEFLDDPGLWKKILHVDDRERVLAENEITSATGADFRMEYRLIAKDGQPVWVRDEAVLVRSKDGTPMYWLGVWIDITMRRKAQDEQDDLIGVMTKRNIQLQTAAEVSRAASSILDTNKLLPTVVELIRNHFDYYYVGIFLVDETREWAILRAGTGEPGEKMLAIGHKLKIGNSSMIGWCISHREARIALDVVEDGVRFKNPYLPLTRSEMALPLIVHTNVIGAMTIQSSLTSAFSPADMTTLQTVADQVATAIVNARLFTDRAALIKELEARNSELERFTYTVSHDLRSPLVTIRGFLGYLREDAASQDLARFDTDINRIANAVDKMQALLNDLLELSRIGRIINAPEDIPFGQIVNEAIELIVGPLEAGKIKLEIQGDLPVIHGDHTRLVEVIQNLISNAIKFMGDQPEPRIEVGVHGFEADGKPVFFVRDNGVGIDPQYHERIFGLFNRLDPNIEGTGIGLALVKRIIEVHDGRIWVESQPGSGATFFFTLPLARA